MSGVIIYLVLMLPPGSSDLPESRRATVCFLFGLASDGVYTAFSVTRQAVVSYTAFSPLPLRAVIFCCTFLGVTSTGRYPASCPMKPGLSSPAVFRHLQLRPSVLLLHLCDFIIFFKTCKVLLSPDYIIQKISAVRRCRCKCITALILRMSIMSFYPNKRNLMRFFRL